MMPTPCLMLLTSPRREQRGKSHYDSYNVVKSMDKLFDELFIHPFIGGGHRDEQNNNEQK